MVTMSSFGKFRSETFSTQPNRDAPVVDARARHRYRSMWQYAAVCGSMCTGAGTVVLV